MSREGGEGRRWAGGGGGFRTEEKGGRGGGFFFVGGVAKGREKKGGKGRDWESSLEGEDAESFLSLRVGGERDLRKKGR